MNDERLTRDAGRSTLDTRPSPPAEVEIHIDELVLHGFDPRQGNTMGEVLARELHRLFSRKGPGNLPNKDAVEVLDGGTVEWNGRTAGSIGARVGESIYRALVR